MVEVIERKIFLASSKELENDREKFENFINRKNKDWIKKGVFLELVIWEDFLDALSKTRLQDEYDKEIRKCDVFVMLFWTKVGKYTEEEFDTAVGQFKATERPFIFTYFKDAEPPSVTPNEDDLKSVSAFKKKLDELGHFYTRYKNTAELQLHFSQQLDKLVANGFIEFKPDKQAVAVSSYNANLTGSGAIAQGSGAIAIEQGGVSISGSNSGDINTGTQIRGDFVRGDKVLGDKVGTQINTGGGAYVGGSVSTGGDFVGRDRITHGISPRDLEALFAPLLSAVAQQAPSGKQAAAVQQVQELKAEVAKGKEADDSKIGKIVDGLVGTVPGAIGTVVSMFAAPILGGIAGPVTRYVLDRLQHK